VSGKLETGSFRCKVPGMSLLGGLSCYVLLDRFGIMSVYVSTCAACHFDTSVKFCQRCCSRKRSMLLYVIGKRVIGNQRKE